MLTNIHVEHFKAFEKADVPVKPITILLGANSVGKSSIIQLLLAMEQTAMVDYETYTSCLKIYGHAVNLGSAENIFRKFETEKPVVLSFTINNEMLLYEYQNMYDEYLEDIKRVERYIPIPESQTFRKNTLNTKNKYISYIKKIKNIVNKEDNEYIKERLSYYPVLIPMAITFGNIMDAELVHLEKLYDLLYGLKKLSISDFEFKFKISYKDRSTLILDGFSLSSNGNVLFSYEENNGTVNIFSCFICFDDVEKKNIIEGFSNDSTLFTCFEKGKHKNEDQYDILGKDIISAYLFYTIDFAFSALKETFKASSINHVSPLRAHPKRYYMLDKANVTYSLDTLDGDAIAEALKENEEIKKKVNKWFENFKLSVDVEEFKEVIHHLKVKQNGLSLDITDVGFGISQVLPIIIQGFLSKNNSLTIIEQPEIHLHPKMQADLADLFIDMVKINEGKAVIVETHSEYLLKRLRRRISEGKIKPEMVSICLFHPQTDKEGARIEHLNIEKKGFFEWPESFYDGELSKDITVFIKNQD